METPTINTLVRSIPYVYRNIAGRTGRVIDVDNLNNKLWVFWEINPDGSKMIRPFKGWISSKNVEVLTN